MNSKIIYSLYPLDENDIEFFIEKYTDRQLISFCTFDNMNFRLYNDGKVHFSGQTRYGEFDEKQWRDIQKIFCGEHHIVALKNDTTVIAYGDNAFGQCDVSQWENIAFIFTGDNMTVGITRDGNVLKTDKQFSLLCETKCTEKDIKIKYLNKVLENYRTLAEKYDTLQNKYDTLKKQIQSKQAEKSAVQSVSSVEATNTEKFVQQIFNNFFAIVNAKKSKKTPTLLSQNYLNSLISCGYYHLAVLKANGHVMASGTKIYGSCNVWDWNSIIAVSAGYFCTVGLKSDGTVVAVGNNIFNNIIRYNVPYDVSQWNNIIAVDCGREHIVGLRTDGTIIATGQNNFQQCNIVSWNNIIAVAVGEYHTVGLKADGTVIAVGKNNCGQCAVENWTNIIGIVAGKELTLGIKYDGTVNIAGVYPNDSQKTDIAKNIVSTSTGEYRITHWRNIIAAAAGEDHILGLHADGTVTALGKNTDGKCNVSAWQNIVAISACEDGSLGLQSDGRLIACGKNRNGKFDIVPIPLL